MEANKLEELLVLFETDFDDLTRGELQFLRNRYREETGVKDTLTEDELFEAYLNFKRKYHTDFEMLLFTPRQQVIKGVFACKVTDPKAQIPTFKSLSDRFKGYFIVQGYTSLPILTVRFKNDVTEVFCIAPNGDFCSIRSDRFEFKI